MEERVVSALLQNQCLTALTMFGIETCVDVQIILQMLQMARIGSKY